MKLRIEQRAGSYGPQLVLVGPDGSVIEGQVRVTVTDAVDQPRRVTVDLILPPEEADR